MRLVLRLSLLAALCSATVAPAMQDPGPRSVTPDHTQPPAGAVAALSVFAKGVQIYRCQTQDSAPAWVFIAPEASLYESSRADGPVAGTHGAGPVWRWKDGSAVIGKLLEKQPSPEAGAIPWLLLSASTAEGSAPEGRLHRIGYVRRSQTQGGAAPATGCDAQHITTQVRIPYTATYTFYSSRK